MPVVLSEEQVILMGKVNAKYSIINEKVEFSEFQVELWSRIWEIGRSRPVLGPNNSPRPFRWFTFPRIRIARQDNHDAYVVCFQLLGVLGVLGVFEVFTVSLSVSLYSKR